MRWSLYLAYCYFIFRLRTFFIKPHKYLYSVLILSALMYNIFLPQATSAENDTSLFNLLIPREVADDVIDYSKDYPNRFSLSSVKSAKYTRYITATAYSSTPDQTDDTPCITANGFDVCEHGNENIIAANFLPLGTKVRFPELFGDQIFYVMDRMNARYYERVDFWMISRESAKKFGKRNIKIEVL